MLARHQRGVARGLPQAEQRLEHREHIAPLGELLDDVSPGCSPNRVVHAALRLVELDREHCVGPRR